MPKPAPSGANPREGSPRRCSCGRGRGRRVLFGRCRRLARAVAAHHGFQTQRQAFGRFRGWPGDDLDLLARLIGGTLAEAFKEATRLPRARRHHVGAETETCARGRRAGVVGRGPAQGRCDAGRQRSMRSPDAQRRPTVPRRPGRTLSPTLPLCGTTGADTVGGTVMVTKVLGSGQVGIRGAAVTDDWERLVKTAAARKWPDLQRLDRRRHHGRGASRPEGRATVPATVPARIEDEIAAAAERPSCS